MKNSFGANPLRYNILAAVDIPVARVVTCPDPSEYLKRTNDMLITSEDANARLSSSQNLASKLKSLTGSAGNKATRKNAMTLFGVPRPTDSEPTNEHVEGSEAPSIDNIMRDAESKIKLALAHDKAVGIMEIALDALESKLDEIKPEKLPAVITSVSKMVTDIRKERIEAEKIKQGNREVHLHFYSPTQREMKEFDIIDVS